jgi:hypothetical protein
MIFLNEKSSSLTTYPIFPAFVAHRVLVLVFSELGRSPWRSLALSQSFAPKVA